MDIRDLFSAGMGIVMFLTAFLLKDWSRRMVALETGKADRTDVDALEERVEQSSNALNNINVELATLREQMHRVVSDIESEKRTRADANSRLLDEMRRMENAILTRFELMLSNSRRKGDQA